MITFLFDWRMIAHSALIALVVARAWSLRRQWQSGVLDYGYNRVEKTVEPKRFRFWFTADVLVFTFTVLGAANWIAQQ